jgi:hypothetical protein
MAHSIRGELWLVELLRKLGYLKPSQLAAVETAARLWLGL